MNSNFAGTKSKQSAITGARKGPMAVPVSDEYVAECKVAYLLPVGKNIKMVYDFVLSNGYHYKYEQSVLINGNTMVPSRKDPTIMELNYGFQQCERLSMTLTGKGIEDHEPTLRATTVERYDFSQKKNVPVQVEAFPDMAGKKLYLGIKRKIRNKMRKEDDGSFVTLNERKEEPTIESSADIKTRKTFTEIRDAVDEPVKFDKWVKANKGKDYMAYVEQAGTATAGVPTGAVSSNKTSSKF